MTTAVGSVARGARRRPEGAQPARMTPAELRAYIDSLPEHPPKAVIREGLRYLVEVDALRRGTEGATPQRPPSRGDGLAGEELVA